MAYDGTGTYSLPANSWNPAVDGVEVSADDWNDVSADLETALSNVICKDGQTTTTVRIPFAAGASFFDGTVGAPGWSFTSDSDNGAYRTGANTWGLSAGGVANLIFTASGITTNVFAQSVVGPTPAAGASGYASFRLPHGAAPTTNLTNGDMWTTTAGVFFRINGTTKTYAEVTSSNFSFGDGSGVGLSLTTTRGQFQLTNRIYEYQGVVVYPVTADTTQAVIAVGGAIYGPPANGQAFGFLEDSSGGTVWLLRADPAGGNSGAVRVITTAGVAVTNATLSGKTLYVHGSFFTS